MTLKRNHKTIYFPSYHHNGFIATHVFWTQNVRWGDTIVIQHDTTRHRCPFGIHFEHTVTGMVRGSIHDFMII